MRIFYALAGDFTAGGQLNTLDHVLALRAWGQDARLLILPPPGRREAFVPTFPPGIDAPPWQLGAEGVGATDVVVVGEMFGAGALALQGVPARKVLHNQNPYYSFEAFRDIAAMKSWGCERILCASGFVANFLRQAGWDGPVSVVRPFVDPVFEDDVAVPRQAAVAFMPRKRRRDAKLIHGLALSRRPALAPIPWVALDGVARAECARVFQRAAVFLSLSYQEGLGLPPLEAMACGALVVGFHGGGGQEYATPANGDWFGDHDVTAVADALIARIEAFQAGERFEARIAAGQATAVTFSRPAFDSQLRAAWAEILA